MIMKSCVALSALMIFSANAADYPLEGKIRRLHEQNRVTELQPARSHRELYLDIMEKIVRMASTWVDARGAVIDPVSGQEWGQTSPRFAASAAVVLHFGRSRDLLDTVVRTMDYCTNRLKDPAVRSSSPDFWMRELATAYFCLKPLVPAEVSERWRRNLAAVEPEKIYKVVDPSRAKLGELANWAVYSSGGEAMREALGIGGSPDFLWGYNFFDLYMKPQSGHITEYGMYRDPDDPITYDITTRLQIANALYWGYRGDLYATYDEYLRRGGLTGLLFVSPEGFVPFGGRSGEFQFREAIISALCELEAIRYKKAGDPVMAGRFRRQAYRSASAVLPWINEDPLRHIKNHFPPESLHGCDRYGQYSVYSLFASSVFGLAALYADDSLEEAPTFAETGGFVLSLEPAFHKLFANCGGNYVEIDTCADLHNDATGLGRILLKGVPYGLLPAMPFPSEPKYRLDERTRPPVVPAAIGPRGLAGIANIVPELNVEKETPEEVAWSLTWALDGEKIVQSYELSDSGLKIRCVRTGGDGKPLPLVFEIPVLHFDGKDSAKWRVDGKIAIGSYKGATAEIRSSAELQSRQDEFANRNGVYRMLTTAAPTGTVELFFKSGGLVE